jgi:acyl dehydratase
MPAKSLETLQSMVGESHVTTTDLHVEAGKVAEFARATMADAEVFYDDAAAEAAGHEAIPAPLTFLRVASFPRYRASGVGDDLGFDLGFDEEHTIHGQQDFEFERPVTVGDSLTGTTTLEHVYEREGGDGTMTFAVLATEFTDADDDPIATARKTIIEMPGSNGGDGE